MKHNKFKDQLFEVLNENDVVLRIADIDTDDAFYSKNTRWKYI